MKPLSELKNNEEDIRKVFEHFAWRYSKFVIGEEGEVDIKGFDYDNAWYQVCVWPDGLIFIDGSQFEDEDGSMILNPFSICKFFYTLGYMPE